MTERKAERRGLGRGLSALMADVRLTQDSEDQSSQASGAEAELPIEQLTPNPNQPRRDYEPAALADLVSSIRQKGILQPLIVRPTAQSDRYEIVAGERRWRAAQAVPLHRVPVIIRTLDDGEVLEIAIIENIQRSDLNAIEEAAGYRQLMDRFGHTQEKLSEALSKSRSHIANLLRLLSLPDEVQLHLRQGRLSAGHARALINAANPIELAAQVISRGLSVRETEALARSVGATKVRGGAGARGRSSEKDADTRAIEGDLSANLGMAVSINHEAGGEKGRLTITYNTLADLDLLCRALSMLPRDGNF